MPSPQLQDERVRLCARPTSSPKQPLAPGLHPLGLSLGRDGLLSVPPAYRPDTPAPLLVLLHGAGADAACLLPGFQEQADAAGLLVLAPDSRGRTWDMILGE